jgi:two-component system, OmpR family, response regulator CpxR
VATESRDHAARSIESAVSVLLVDDDESLCGMMGQVLPYYGMRLDAVHNGYHGLRQALEGRHDLLLIDMRLPGLDGLELLRQVRRRSHVPVIIITAGSDEADRVSGLDAGADDYLSKPFGIDELLARIRAVLRRTARGSHARPPRLDANGITIETGLREVRIGAAMVQVTSTEYELLEYLVRHAGRIVPRDELMAVVCQREASSLDRSLDVHVSRLRRKLADRASTIRTVRGVGYMFCVAAPAD